MVRYVPDATKRFRERPYWLESELDQECERIVVDFLQHLHGRVGYPISTEDLKILIEEEARDLDQYADLSGYGRDVEGVTEFEPGRKPRVRIAALLSEDERRENRLRTTLAHEYGHAKFHAALFDAEPLAADLFASGPPEPEVVVCKRDGIVDAPKVDWMEWQAGHISGAVLMPITAARRAVIGIQERFAVFGPALVTSEAGAAMIRTIMETFQVSSDAARIRLLRLNVLGIHSAPPSLFEGR
jgi:hypothetical protein